jgi:hypothetical protein
MPTRKKGTIGYFGGINLAVLRYSGDNGTDPISDPTADAPTVTAVLNENVKIRLTDSSGLWFLHWFVSLRFFLLMFVSDK